MIDEAHAVEAAERTSLVGTVGYMAPEQAAGIPVDLRADSFSVGVVLYRALTSHFPWGGDSHESVALKQRLSPPAPSEVSTRVPPDLDALCVDLLQLDPRRGPPPSTSSGAWARAR